MNSVVLVGRLATDPEIKNTQGGVALTEFVLAAKRNCRSEGGENETDFIPIVAWRQNAEFAAQYLTKGRLVSVEGCIRTSRWKSQDGQNHSTVEVVADRLKSLDKPKE